MSSYFVVNFDYEMGEVYSELLECFPDLELVNDDIRANVSGVLYWRDGEPIDHPRQEYDLTFLVKVPTDYSFSRCQLEDLEVFKIPPKKIEYPELEALFYDDYYNSVIRATAYVDNYRVICYSLYSWKQ